eukprot:7067801-Lingulodinium_polyedra.AAC.1
MAGVDRLHGHKSGMELPLDQVCLAREREIGLVSDHGMYDIVESSKANGKRVRAKWLDDWGKEGIRSRLVAMELNWVKRDDVQQNTPPLVVAR